MPRSCTVCAHADKEGIDAALVAGEALRDIAGRHGVSKSALERHKADHLPASLAKAKHAAEIAHGDNLLDQVRSLQVRTHALLDKAGGAGDLNNALKAIGQARSNLELLAKLLGELSDAPTVNVTVSPEWISVCTVIIAALAPFPDARASVAERLLALEPRR